MENKGERRAGLNHYRSGVRRGRVVGYLKALMDLEHMAREEIIDIPDIELVIEIMLKKAYENDIFVK